MNGILVVFPVEVGTSLYGYLYPVSFGVVDDTFVIPVAGSPGLSYHLDSVLGHLPGESVHIFFGSDGKAKMGKTEMFHVKRWSYVGAVHDFEAGTALEGDESARELFCRIVVKRLDYSTEILPVEFADFVNVIDPDGYVFDSHKPSTLIHFSVNKILIRIRE